MFFLSAFFFFCRHVFLLCLFLGVSLIFSCSDLFSDGNPFACPVSLSPLCIFHGFSAFFAVFICDFSLFKFFCMGFSAWLRFLDSDFFHMTHFLPVRRFSSGAAPLSRCAASLLSCFSEGHSLFLLFRVRLYSFLIPHLNAFFLLMLTCGLIGFVVGAYRDSFFPQSLHKALCSFIYTACEGSRQVPVSTLRQSRFIRFAEIPHADCPSNPNTLPSCRLFVFKVCFRFFSKPICLPRALPKKGYFFCLLNRFFIDSFLLPYPFPFFVSFFVKLVFTL